MLLPPTSLFLAATLISPALTLLNPPTPPASVLIVADPGLASPFGATSPEPNPSWRAVAAQLSRRLPNFGTGVVCSSASCSELPSLSSPPDVLLALGLSSPAAAASLSAYASRCPPAVFLADPSCGAAVLALQRAGPHRPGSPASELLSALPFTRHAEGKRLLATAASLLGRSSSEDALYAMLFALHAFVSPQEVVASDINPSWEKGVLQNAREFKKMADCCGPEIKAALTDPETKSAIDLLNAVDLRDQVGSYRVIVSKETPQLEDFTLCVLQRNNCFGCDAPVLDRPRVPALGSWGGEPLSEEAAARILTGHLDHPAAHPEGGGEAWSWRVACGANPAYDAFPLQHQVFYPAKGGGKSLW
jgi:hypothetical protein